MRPFRTALFLLPLVFLAGPACWAQTGPAGGVSVSDGLLSVRVENAPIAGLISEIGRKAGFTVEISPGVTKETVSTNFADMELQRGIRRLFALVQHKNFFIHYGEDGLISKIEVLSTLEAAPAARGGGVSRSRRPVPPRRRAPSARGRRPMPPRPAPMPEPMPMAEDPAFAFPGQPGVPEEPFMPPGEHMPPEMEEQAGGVPYIPPRRAPAYIPPGH